MSSNGINYKIIKRNVKYPRLEIKENSLYLIVPFWFNDYDRIIEEKRCWIEKKLSRIEKIISENKDKLDKIILFGNTIDNKKLIESLQDEKIKKKTILIIKKKLRSLISGLVEEYSRKLDVSYNKVYIRKQETKWGSCSSRKNLSFNIKVAALPLYLIEFLVYHEVVHLIEMNHGKKFREILEKKFRDCKVLEEELKKYWVILDSNLFWRSLLR